MTQDSTKAIGGGKAAGGARRCPICGKPAVAEFRAFCSRRCADIDLNRWLTGVYVVPGKDDQDENGERGPAPGDTE
jgi:endogenous inhibitor of DNA gyrase (YacG/DUF329 family)